MTKPKRRFSLRSWFMGESSLFDEDRSVLLDFEGVPEDRPPEPRRKHRRHRHRRGGGILSRHYRFYRVLSICATVVLMALLLLSVYQLPRFGDPDTPSNNGVSERYVRDGAAETGALNTVTGMILDYRAFDTFGESTVLFAATMAVLFLLQMRPYKTHLSPPAPNRGDPLLKGAVRMIFPFILLYGFYVVLNGHLSPGGGFSGGAVLGAGMILYSAAFGRERLAAVLSPERTSRIIVLGLLVYAALKSFSFFTGANQMDITIPKGTLGNILSAGFIVPLNICVGIVVACTVFTFFLLFTEGDN
jgi:multicomponent Na+:H+ antiporter subunit B